MESEFAHAAIRSPEAAKSAGGHARDGATSAELDARADEVLRCALRPGGRTGVADAQVREAVRRTCDAAHDCNLYVEEVLVILKARWRNLPEARLVPSNVGDGLFARVITLCISEYYARARER